MISVLNSVRKKLPGKREEELLRKEVEAFVKKLEERIRGKGLDAEVFLGGAWAKGTWLEDADIDIFIRFSREEDIQKAPLILKGIDHTVIHGSRDYFRSGRFEMVPILKIDGPEGAKNVTDVSPFHVGFVRKNLKSRDDVRLLKLFCKSTGVYGAESHIKGFSGYVIELLIIKYGSFENVIKAAEKWVPKVEIDFGGKTRLKEQKTKSPIIIYDPTLPGRNAAAGLDYESFSKFLLRSRMFLRNPSEKFFKISSITKEEIISRSRKRGTKLFMKEVPVKGRSEIFFSKLERDMKRIVSNMTKQGFSVYDHGFFDKGKKALVFFEMETWLSSRRRKHFGPPVWVGGKYFDEFLLKWKEVYVSNGRLAVDVIRENDGIKALRKVAKEYGL